MKNFLKILFVCFFGLTSFAQQATEIDSKSVRLPRYTNLTAIQAAITSPQQGMMVYNVGTATNWYYNGSNWTNLATATSAPTEAEGFGSWACSNASLIAYQPVGNFNGQIYNYFGISVAISGVYAIVGANSDNEGFVGGSATIFKRNSGTGVWESQGKLTNPNPANSDLFGSSVAISGEYAIVGAYGDDEGIGLTNNGSATIFKRNSGTGVWESQGKLTNPSAANSDLFGVSVAISGDYAIVGAYFDDELGFTENGSATIFKRNSGTGVWESQGKLTNPSAANSDLFGYSVAISGDYAIVGARSDDEGFTDNGSATIYRRYGNVWRNLPKTSDPSAANYDYFGASVAIDGSTARFLIGAFGSSSYKGLAVFGQVK